MHEKELSNPLCRTLAFKVQCSRGGVEDTRLEAKAKAKDTKKSEAKAKAKDSLSEDRHSRGQHARGQGQGPRTQSASALQKKKKKGLHKNFSGDLQKKKKKKKRSSQKFFKRSPRTNAFQKIFQPLHKILTYQKIVLSSSRGQANFRGLEPRGQGQGLDLRGQGQGQGLQNLSSKTSSRPRTSSRTPPLQCSIADNQNFVIDLFPAKT